MLATVAIALRRAGLLGLMSVLAGFPTACKRTQKPATVEKDRHEAILAQAPRASAIRDASPPRPAVDGQPTRDVGRAAHPDAQPETGEELCALLGFPDPDVPKCDDTRYAQCIPAPFCGTDTAPSGSVEVTCPVVWIASSMREQKTDYYVWQLRHVDGAGHETSIQVSAHEPPPCHTGSAADDNTWNELDASYPFDYDGDGEPELLFRQQQGTFDTGIPGVLLTVKNGAAQVYWAPPPDYFIEDASDADGDKRPDIRLKVLMDGDKDSGCGGYAEAVWSPLFLAHSLADGSFDVSDKAAVDSARTWCPKKPAKVQALEDILCVRLWRGSVRSLERRFQRELQDCQSAIDDDDQDGCIDAHCNTEEAQLKLLRWKPPVVLIR